MSSERRRKRTRIVPRLIFQTATLVPALAACGGDASERSSGHDAAADRSATGGTGNRPGTGGSGGGGGVIALALGGFGGSGNSGGVGNVDGAPVDGSADATDASSGGTGGYFVLAMNGFGAGGAGDNGDG